MPNFSLSNCLKGCYVQCAYLHNSTTNETPLAPFQRARRELGFILSSMSFQPLAFHCNFFYFFLLLSGESGKELEWENYAGQFQLMLTLVFPLIFSFIRSFMSVLFGSGEWPHWTTLLTVRTMFVCLCARARMCVCVCVCVFQQKKKYNIDCFSTIPL